MTVEYMITNSTVIWWFDLLSSKRWHNPANICWSSRRLQVMSWRRLQHVFSVTIFRIIFGNTSWRRLEDISQDVLKTSSRRLGRQKIVTLKTFWRRLEDMSWRCLKDALELNKMFTGDMYLTMAYQQI